MLRSARFGRAGFDYIDLELPNVSRKHARIVYDGTAYHLENWYGRLGIGVYERRLDIGQSHTLRHCDRFRIPDGDGPHVRLIFLLADQTRYLPFEVEAQRPNMRVFGLDVKCSPLEYRLLLYLQQHAGQLCRYDELIAHLWPDSVGRKGHLEVLLSGVRKKIQATLQHPNIVHVYHLEEDPDSYERYLICEYVAGGSLADHLQAHGPIAQGQAIVVALAICHALEATAEQQIVHRDIKPSNILLLKDDRGEIVSAKLGDFGVAQDRKQPRTTHLPGMLHHPGTPEYMAPEQADITQPVDTRTESEGPSATHPVDTSAVASPIVSTVTPTAQPPATSPEQQPEAAGVATTSCRQPQLAGPSIGSLFSRPVASIDGSVGSEDLARRAVHVARLSLASHPARVVFSPDARLLAIVFDDGAVQLWQMNDGALSQAWCVALPTNGRIIAAAFASNSKALVTGSSTGRLETWGVDDGGSLGSVDLPAEKIVSLAFAPDGQTVAAGVDDGTRVQLFRIEDGHLLRTLHWNAAGATRLIFSPDGKSFAVGMENGGMVVSRVADGRGYFHQI